MTSIKKSASRKFCSLPEDGPAKNSRDRPSVLSKNVDASKLMKYIDDNVIGKNATFLGPFGRRRVVYCDYAASGRALQFIEDYIIKEVLPLYGNTHTSTNVTSLQSTLFRNEARDILRNSTHASEDDVVIFAGHGSTGAIRKLIHALDLTEPPVLFVGSSEHHSVLLPWREIGSKIVRILETKEGLLDLVELERQLSSHRASEKPGTVFIGCFSAASNITGILADDIATTVLLHQYNALAFWDYATAAPYIALDMNPILPGNDKAAYKDAIFFSGHKFVGGVQSPGVLIAKKSLFQNTIPEGSGGGTVFFVSKDSHRYLQDIEMREEGGTGAIVESVRIGLAMYLKETVGPQNIASGEEKITKTVLSFLRTIPEVILLGNSSHKVKRISVFSFVVKHPRGTFLHYNFVCAILNDVFGIQTRGGCACAGPYAHDLLGIDEELTEMYEDALLEDERLDRRHLRRREECSPYEMLRPGFTRVSLPYFISNADLTFVLESIKMVATEGWKLLPQYILNPETGEWKHRNNMVFRDRKWLNNIKYTDGKMEVNYRKISGQSAFPQDNSDCLQMARNVFNRARRVAHRCQLPDQSVIFDEEKERLRWFMLPCEAEDLLLGNGKNVKTIVPFSPGAHNITRANSDSEKHRGSEYCYRLLDLPSSLARHNSMSALEINHRKRRNKLTTQNICSDCCTSINVTSHTPDSSGEISPICRTRCHSLESNTRTHPKMLRSSPPFKQCSCSSQTDISDSDSSSQARDGYLSGNVSDSGDMGINNLFPNSDQEHIEAYVKGVTEELATEIKSELREVIATVDNALCESTESLDINSQYSDKRYSIDSKMHRHHLASPFMSRNNSFPVVSPNYSHHSVSDIYSLSHDIPSCPITRRRIASYSSNGNSRNSPEPSVGDQVAVYLAELTTEVVTEMKSEFREMVNAVDDLIISVDKNISESDKSSEKLAKSPSPNCQKDDIEKASTSEDVVETCTEDVAKKDQNVGLNDSSDDSGIVEVEKKVRDTGRSELRTPRSLTAPLRKFSLLKEEDEFRAGYSGSCDRLLSQEKRKRSLEGISINPKWHCPPKSIWKPMVEAIREFDMIREGDRVLVCLSGGKDSLSLLHALHQYQYYSQSNGVNFVIGAATVDPGSSAYDPRPLIPYLHALGVHYLYEEQRILEKAKNVGCSSICSFCSRLKRGRLYKAARTNNYNVLALGQHLDDLAESFLMSVFHNGRLRSMKAHYYISDRDLRVIRPFVYVREKHLRQFAENRKLPVIAENCPACFEAPKERHRTKQLLAQQEILHPKLFASLRSAVHPLMTFRYTTDEAVYQNRKPSSAASTHDENGNSDTEEEDPPV